MENEGIMALPQGAAMPGEQAQEQQSVTSAQSYDAAQTALGMASPDDLATLKESLRQNMADLELTPSQLTTLIEIFEYMSQRPAEYNQLRQELINNDFVDAEDLPEEYDPELIGALLSVLNELQMTQAQGAQAPMMDMPPVEGADAMQGMGGMQPMAMAQGGLADVASFLAAQGRNGDKMLAHITPEEAELLRARGGSGTINPTTGLPEFFLKKVFKAVKSVVKSVVNVAKKVLKSPVGRILATVALATVLGPAGVGLSMGTAAGVAGAGTTLMAGGSLKEALISGAMGYIGGGGTIMGASPVASLGTMLPGAAGSALNTGLSTGLIGAGVGKLGGMSTEDALKMGLTSGASAAALQGLQNMKAGQPSAQGQAQTQAAPQADGSIQPGGVGQTGAVGTAQDILASQSAPGGSMPADYQAQFYKDIGIDPRTMSPTSVGPSPTNIQIERGSLGMTGVADTARQFMKEPINVAKDIYNTNLSPSRPGLPADAGILQKYGPAALAGTAVIGAAGGFQSKPGDPNPLFNQSEANLESERRARERSEFMEKGGFGLERPVLSGTYNPIVQTNFATQTATSQPGQIVPMGMTMSPGGVAQPYNVAGLYGVPLIYGQGAQPQRLAKGGSPVPTEFPRKTGPINGPGTGTSDDIPAMLSDGEFVFTAKAVRNAGNGSRRKGAARMYKLMKMLEGGPVKGK